MHPKCHCKENECMSIYLDNNVEYLDTVFQENFMP